MNEEPVEGMTFFLGTQSLEKTVLDYFLKSLETLNQSRFDKSFILRMQDYLSCFPYSLYQIKCVHTLGFFYLDDVDDYIKKELMQGFRWELHIQEYIKKLVKEGDHVIDVGAHIGSHTMALSKAVKDKGKVFSFEPQPKIYRELCFNLALNETTNVIPMQVALGDDHGLVKMQAMYENNEGSAFASFSNDLDFDAHLVRLDDLHLENISFMKIDAENAELNVLKGAKNTLQKYKPTILLELQGNTAVSNLLNVNSDDVKEEIIAFLRQLDYEIFHILDHDFIAICRSQKHQWYEN
jgi:FkbM family methyltransferase